MFDFKLPDGVSFDESKEEFHVQVSKISPDLAILARLALREYKAKKVIIYNDFWPILEVTLHGRHRK